MTGDTAIFSVANKVLLEPLPHPHAVRLLKEGRASRPAHVAAGTPILNSPRMSEDRSLLAARYFATCPEQLRCGLER